MLVINDGGDPLFKVSSAKNVVGDLFLNVLTAKSDLMLEQTVMW